MDNENAKKYGFSREEVISVISRYVTNERLEEFVKNHPVQIADLQKGRISGVFKGFQKRNSPEETYDARLTLKRQKDESTGKVYISSTPIFKQKFLKIPESFTMDGVQVSFSEKQRDELINDGRLSETFKFTGQNGTKREMFISVDRELNRIAWMPATFLHVPNTFYQTIVTQEQKELLMAGKKAPMNINFQNGRQDVNLYFDPALNTIRVEPVQQPEAVSPEAPAEKVENKQQTEKTEKSDKTEKKKPTRKLEGKQKQQTKAKTIGKAKSAGINL
ncbi:MAG: DUF3945 domain-containing protein [Bacteroidales bacterium]|jgi:hypothetical protein|nr:DUF3945 domain-containing protein [Bacteroidales bacterium]